MIGQSQNVVQGVGVTPSLGAGADAAGGGFAVDLVCTQYIVKTVQVI
jgi:hypothetical protein